MRQLILTHIRKTRENKFFMVILITIIILTPIMVMGNSKYGILGFFFPFVVSMHIFSAATKIERIEGFRIGEDILLNSLPVSRKEIVLSRYLIIFLFGMSAMLLSVLSQITVSAAFKRPIAISKEVFIIFIVCQFIYNILFIPLEYFDNKKANTIKGILYGLTIYFVSKKNLSVPFDYIINLKGIAPAVVFAGIIILSIYYSIFLSIKIYEKKEF